MKIPKYIQAHIETNNRCLAQASKHSEIVLDWYREQLKKLDAENSEIPDDDFSDIQNNWLGNGEISILAIQENLELLENK